MDVAIWWIKRDLRLADNQALTDALSGHPYVLPVFVIEPELLSAPDSSRFHWHNQLTALKALRHNIQRLGADILVLHQDIIGALSWLHNQLGFSHLYSHQETGTLLTYQRDEAVACWCRQHRVSWHQPLQQGVIRALPRMEARARLIRQRLFAMPPLQPPTRLPFHHTLAALCHDQPTVEVSGLALEDVIARFTGADLQPVTEQYGLDTLNSFLHQRGASYRGGISSPNRAFQAGSRLSPHLAWGTLSLRQVFTATAARMEALKAEPGADASRWRASLSAFQSRLHWHCHFIQRLELAADMEQQAINPAYRQIAYRDDPQRLTDWINGRTGFPLVDACMRCLHHGGFVNFRMRAMVVNFACYALHLDWRALHAPLAQLFADYEPGIHLSQLQMQAGVMGINTLRVYNVSKQLTEQDPEGHFCRRYVPELRQTPMADWLNPHHRIPGYPRPIVHQDSNIHWMKQQISAIRNSESARQPTQAVLQRYGSRHWRNDRSTNARRRKHHDTSPRQMSLDW